MHVYYYAYNLDTGSKALESDFEVRYTYDKRLQTQNTTKRKREEREEKKQNRKNEDEKRREKNTVRGGEGYYAGVDESWKDSRGKSEHLPSNSRLYEESI